MRRVPEDQIRRGACSTCGARVETGDGHHHPDPWFIVPGTAHPEAAAAVAERWRQERKRYIRLRCPRCGRFARYDQSWTWYCDNCERAVRLSRTASNDDWSWLPPEERP